MNRGELGRVIAKILIGLGSVYLLIKLFSKV